ncbi:hypothetical protein SAMN04489747_2416 [Auraticoccus monumenti]|uniref:Uncharacterized protein n=1 Tax=Auraticoccus monumenti TaxID=675864 RepID=A0A1G6ZVI8_9ACTN|nr:hypothetical protein SAMN04489747_2416 [Auraticoccus monumenti]
MAGWRLALTCRLARLPDDHSERLAGCRGWGGVHSPPSGRPGRPGGDSPRGVASSVFPTATGGDSPPVAAGGAGCTRPPSGCPGGPGGESPRGVASSVFQTTARGDSSPAVAAGASCPRPQGAPAGWVATRPEWSPRPSPRRPREATCRRLLRVGRVAPRPQGAPVGDSPRVVASSAFQTTTWGESPPAAAGGARLPRPQGPRRAGVATRPEWSSRPSPRRPLGAARRGCCGWGGLPPALRAPRGPGGDSPRGVASSISQTTIGGDSLPRAGGRGGGVGVGRDGPLCLGAEGAWTGQLRPSAAGGVSTGSAGGGASSASGWSVSSSRSTTRSSRRSSRKGRSWLTTSSAPA